VCPNLIALVLDPVHLVIVYNQAFWRKRTPGQTLLRRMQHKFNKTNFNMAIHHWGHLYDGSVAVNPSRAEQNMRGMILDGSMSVTRAKAIVAGLRGDEPWDTPLSYMQGLAALSALYPDEMQRKSYVGGKTIAQLLWCAAGPDRVQWFMNNVRHRRLVDRNTISLLGSGTSPNEALNSEINRWFRNQPEVFASTLNLSLRVCWMGKLLTHNSAMYRPTLRQLSSQTVRSVVVQTLCYTEAAWSSWCLTQRECEGIVQPAETQTILHRKAVSVKIKQHALKRPAAALKKSRAFRKRTPFTLKRL